MTGTWLARGKLFAVAILLLPACSGNGDDGGDDIVAPRDAGPFDTRDAGSTSRDGGTRDAGPLDCSTNPNNCVENQQINASCECLAACDNGFEWDQILQMCVPPPAGECEMDGDCGLDEACLNVPPNGGITACNGEDTCRCLLSCDAFVRFERSGCPQQLDFGNGSVDVSCTWVGAIDGFPDGLCLPLQAAADAYGEACTITVQNGQRVADSCDRNRNFTCLVDGRDGNNNTGLCTRFCDAARPADLCETLGNQSCVGRGFTGLDPAIGYCQSPSAMDIATTCTSSVTCAGGICSSILGGTCTQGCGGFDQCPTGDFCIGFNGTQPPEQPNMCIAGCVSPDATGDAECQAGAPNLVCRDVFGTNGEINLCLPPCTQVPCVAMGTTCDPASGRCM